MLTIALALMLPQPMNPSSRFIVQVRAACVSPVGSKIKVDGIKVVQQSPKADDLPRLMVTDLSSGGWMYVYYDVVSKRAAFARAGCLGAQIRLLNAAVGNAWPMAQWTSVVFTTNSSYLAPLGDTTTRWRINVAQNGHLSREAQRTVVLSIPHEQVHAFQSRAGVRGPRWFAEGHAEWIGRKVESAIAPAEAKFWADDLRSALAMSKTPVALARWGGFRPTRAAIMRQMPNEERHKMETDPSYQPSLKDRSFSFGPGDSVEDNSNQRARYEAAWQVFDDLEKRHGEIAVRTWANDITSVAGKSSTASIIASAHDSLDEDMSGMLK